MSQKQRNFTSIAGGLAETSSIINSGTIPLLYAGAMLVDAIAALIFGYMYDKRGVKVLVLSTIDGSGIFNNSTCCNSYVFELSKKEIKLF